MLQSIKQQDLSNDGRTPLLGTLPESGAIGTGKAGFRNGPLHTALFNEIYGIALDGNGVLYIAEEGNARIRMITPP